MKYFKNQYSIDIVESNGDIFQCMANTRDEALKITNAAEKVRHCKAWRMSFISSDYLNELSENETTKH